eukprot:SAG22_NODE_1818_length_3514_cov_10.657980_3_plen_64_part_00
MKMAADASAGRPRPQLNRTRLAAVVGLSMILGQGGCDHSPPSSPPSRHDVLLTWRGPIVLCAQ